MNPLNARALLDAWDATQATVRSDRDYAETKAVLVSAMGAMAKIGVAIFDASTVNTMPRILTEEEAEFATPDNIAFFLHHTSGVICAPVTRERAREWLATRGIGLDNNRWKEIAARRKAPTTAA